MRKSRLVRLYETEIMEALTEMDVDVMDMAEAIIAEIAKPVIIPVYRSKFN